MTVTEKSSRKVISGTGWSNPLTHDFELENATHLKVYADDVLLTLGVDYSVTGVGVDSGYSVTITTPASWTAVLKWVLSVEPPISQADDVSLGGQFGARFEDGIDALTRRVQRLRDDSRRAYKVPRTTAVGEAPTMDVLAEGEFWIADANGNMIRGGDAGDIAAAQANAAAAAASAVAATTSASSASSSATASAASAAAAAAAVLGVTTFVVNSYAEAHNTLNVPGAVKKITLMGRSSYGDRAGIIPTARVNAQPTTHNGWWRSLDRLLADGVTVDATNGGYWEFQVGAHANVAAFGAVSNGITDDFPAIDGARDYLVAKWARGELYFPGSNGPYLCNGTIDLSTCRLTMYAANQAVVVFTGPNDVNLVKINQGNVRVKDISLYGKGITGLATADTDVGVISEPVVWITNGAVNAKIDGCIIYGGTGVFWEGGDCKMYDNEVSRSYGNSLVTIDGSGGKGSGWLRRNALDHAVFLTSQGIQKVATAFPARANSTVYVIGDVVAYNGMLLECTTGGTSGASTPTLKNYNVAMPDGAGTLVWNVVCPVTFYALLCDTDAKEVYCHQQDMSGPFSYGLGFQNCPGLYFRIEDGVIGGVRNGGIIVRTGEDLNFSGLTIGGGPIIGFPGIIVTDTFAGDVRFHHNKLFFVARGVYWAITGATGATLLATDNTIHCNLGTSGTVATAFEAAANTKFFKFSDNVVTGGTIGAQVIAGTSDNYHITNNLNAAGIAPSSFIVDGGTGVNKRIAGNV